jgi:hypothetical protein
MQELTFDPSLDVLAARPATSCRSRRGTSW